MATDEGRIEVGKNLVITSEPYTAIPRQFEIISIIV